MEEGCMKKSTTCVKTFALMLAFLVGLSFCISGFTALAEEDTATDEESQEQIIALQADESGEDVAAAVSDEDDNETGEEDMEAEAEVSAAIDSVVPANDGADNQADVDVPVAIDDDSDDEADATPESVASLVVDGVWNVTSDTTVSNVDGLDRIVVNGDVTLKLDNLNLTSNTGPAIAIESGSVVIELVGDNDVAGAPGYAGIYVAPDAQLTIDGEGSLNAVGGKNGSVTTNDLLYGRSYEGSKTIKFCAGAGIGGNGMALISYGKTVVRTPEFGTVIINGGNVSAAGGNTSYSDNGAGAGIGSGGATSTENDSGDWEYEGSIQINGGTLYATGGDDTSWEISGGAGIGAGGDGYNYYSIPNEIEIEITGGTITAQGGTLASGIGAGNTIDSGPITISGGNVVAYGGSDGTVYGGAGIGSGDEGCYKTITITGTAYVEAYGAGDGAGIGGGYDGNNHVEEEDFTPSILIGGSATVKAYGSFCKTGGAGIGSGACRYYESPYGMIHITDNARVEAYGAGGAAGIGSGSGTNYNYPTKYVSFSQDKIIVDGSATVYAYGGSIDGTTGGAGIGCGSFNAPGCWFDSITIADNATVRAYAGSNAQAIGVGSGFDSDTDSVVKGVVFDGTEIDVWMFNPDTETGAFYGQTEDGTGVTGAVTTKHGANLVWYTTSGDAIPADGTAYVSDDAYADQYTWTADGQTVSIDFLGVYADRTDEAPAKLGNWATLNVKEPEAQLTVSPVSITSYVGGLSASGNHMPTLRFKVDAAEGVDALNLVYTLYTEYKEPTTEDCGHEAGLASTTVSVAKASDGDGSYYLFPELDAGMGTVLGVGQEDLDHDDLSTENGTTVQRSSYFKLVDTTTDAVNSTSDLHAGVYQILKRDESAAHWYDWYLTATDPATGTTYLVDVEADGSQSVTVRYISNEDEMYAYTDDGVDETKNESVMLNLVADTDDDVDTTTGAVAVARKGVAFLTNGDENLGVFGFSEAEDEYVTEDNTAIALLFDDVITGENGMDLGTADLAEYLEASYDDVTLSDWNAQHKYLDLVNVADGNAWVTATGAVGVYWPYPEGMTYEDAKNATFRLFHYAGLDREYMEGVDVTQDAELEEIEVTPTEKGLYFETASFSPYTLLWKTADGTTEEPTTPTIPRTPTAETPAATTADPKSDADTAASAIPVGDKTAAASKTDSKALADTGDASVAVSAIGALGGIGAVLAAAGFRMNRKTRR
jgi:hypothetical protein